MEKFAWSWYCCVGQISRVKVYIGVKIKICLNHVETYTNIFLVSHGFRKYTLLPTSNASVLSYWQEGQMSGFDLYMGQKLKIHQIWLKMVSNYSSENKVPKKNSCDNIICSITIATRQIYWIQSMSMGLDGY